MKDVCNIIKTSNFCFKSFFIKFFSVWYLPGCLFKRNHFFPSNKEYNELLAKVTKRLDLFVFLCSLWFLYAGTTTICLLRYFFLIRDKLWHFFIRILVKDLIIAVYFCLELAYNISHLRGLIQIALRITAIWI